MVVYIAWLRNYNVLCEFSLQMNVAARRVWLYCMLMYHLVKVQSLCDIAVFITRIGC